MATPELSIGGESLLYDWQHQAAQFLGDYQPLEDLVLQVDESIARASGREASRGGDHINLPLPNYPPSPPPRINQLYWPTGASRWARGYFLATRSVAESLQRCSGELDFVASTDKTTFTAKLWVLPPKPVSDVAEARNEGCETLFIVPVVDDRYWWQFKDFGPFGGQSNPSWERLFSWLAGRLGISLSPLVSDAYLDRDIDEFTRPFDNAALILDAAAHCIGERVIRRPDGDVTLMPWSVSKQLLADSFDGEWFQIAGGKLDNQPIPESVVVTFPVLDCGLKTCDGEKFDVLIPYKGNRCTAKNTSRTIQDTAWAGRQTIGEQSAFLNRGELEELASEIARDYYASTESVYDYTFVGIKPWNMNGYDDHVLYSFGEEFDKPSLTAGEEGNVSEEYDRNYTTRIQSMPLNFGVDQMLHQSRIVSKRFERGIFPVELKEGECLHPGKKAGAYHLIYTQNGWQRIDCDLIVQDSFFRTFATPGERFWVRPDCNLPPGTFESSAEYGLQRRAIALENIPCGSSGQVSVFVNKDGNESCDPTESGCVVTACNTWQCGRDIEQGDEIFVEFFERVWQVLPSGGGQQSSSEIALLKAQECLFPGDANRNFTLFRQENCGWSQTQVTVGANDLCTWNMIFTGECVMAARRKGCQGKQQYDIIGSHGLERIGLALTDIECQRIGFAQFLEVGIGQIGDPNRNDPSSNELSGSAGQTSWIWNPLSSGGGWTPDPSNSSCEPGYVPLPPPPPSCETDCTVPSVTTDCIRVAPSLWEWKVPFGQEVANGKWELVSENVEAGFVPVEPDIPGNPYGGLLATGGKANMQTGQSQNGFFFGCKFRDAPCHPIGFCNLSGQCIYAGDNVRLSFQHGAGGGTWIGDLLTPRATEFRAKLSVVLLPTDKKAKVKDVEATDYCMDEDELDAITAVTNYGFSGGVDDTILFRAKRTTCNTEYYAVNVEHHCNSLMAGDCEVTKLLSAAGCTINGSVIDIASVMSPVTPGVFPQITLSETDVVVDMYMDDQSSGSGDAETCRLMQKKISICTFQDHSQDVGEDSVAINFVEQDVICDVKDNGTCVTQIPVSVWVPCAGDEGDPEDIFCWIDCIASGS